MINGKIYIGQSIHFNRRTYLGSGTSITAAIKKYGRKNFKRKILKICFSQKELDAWELVMIKRYNSTDKNIGYNIYQEVQINLDNVILLVYQMFKKR